MQKDSFIRGIATMRGFSVLVNDGEIGSVRDLYFDDRRCVARYIIVDTGGWLSDRKVLIAPMAIRKVDWGSRRISLNLTKKQIESSPGIANDEPVSREFEQKYYAHFQWPAYWTGTGLWGATDYPDNSAKSIDKEEQSASNESAPLRSAAEVIGYLAQGADDRIGNISDILFDDRSWEIRWITIDTRPWWFGGNVLVAVKSIKEISWESRSIRLDLTREQIKDCPELQLGESLTLQEEQQMLERHRVLRKAA
jgi:uncharacterized protein YrrD